MRRIFLVLCLVLASGCASRGTVGSFCGPLPEDAAITAIAADAVTHLSALYPPGHTSLRLLPAKAAENGFVVALENGLRAKGFTLAAPDAADALALAYTLDALEEKSAWYLHLRLSDGRAIARCYTAGGFPEAGQSRTMLEFPRSLLGKVVDAAKNRAGKVSDAAHELMEQATL
jgi:hypothetical protein